MMGYYLLDNPNRNYKQYRETRRNGATNSGTVVLHTAEGGTDFAGPDTKAEDVAAYIARRTTPGSYHVLVDFDSTVPLLPWNYEAWQDTRTNNWAVGISASVNSADWPKLGARGDAIVIRMAHAAREYAAWLKATRGTVIPARRITRAEALARKPGFIGHGDIDTGRRSDPGAHFNWNLFLTTFATGGNTPVAGPKIEEVEKMLAFAQEKSTGRIWVGDGVTRRYVTNPTVLKDLQHKITADGALKGDTRIHVVDSLDWLGTPVPFEIKAEAPKIDANALADTIVKNLSGRIPTNEGIVAAVKAALNGTTLAAK